MRRVWVLLQLGALVAADIVYVTDLTVFSSLAPCAASAVSEAILGLTQSSCPQGVTALESCACSKDNIPKVVSSSIASSVTYLCGSTATEDVASASAVYSAYCNQGSPAPAITPAPVLVTQYITDLAAYSQLAPCAESAVSNAIFSLTDYLCPSGQSALNSCACTKNQNSLAASERINTEVLGSCGSTHTEDITSAQAVFAGYCAMGNGTTSFPTPGSLSGTMTYYITDLPTFQSLAPCAASAITEIFGSLTGYYGDCPSAPAALASCACTKDQNSAFVSSLFVYSVKEYCSSTASDDVTSALGVFNYYCSAAKGQVVPTGITASVAATGTANPGSAQTGTGAGAKPSSTPTTPGSKSTSGASTSGSSSSGSSNGALIGGIAGGVGVVALIGIAFVIWLCRRKRHVPAPLASTSSADGSPDPLKTGVELHQYSKMPSPPLKPQDGIHEVPAPDYVSELGPTGKPAPSSYSKLSSPSQYTKMSSPSLHAVSPVYEAAGLARPGVPEIQGQPGRPNMPEMQGQSGVRPGVPEMYGTSGQPNVPEMQGQGGRPNVPEMYGTGGQPHVPEMPGQAMSYYLPQQQQQQQYGQQGYQQQPGYGAPVYEMGQQQQQQQGLLQPHQQEQFHAVSHNNGPSGTGTGTGMGYMSGPVYEMYTPNPSPH